MNNNIILPIPIPYETSNVPSTPLENIICAILLFALVAMFIYMIYVLIKEGL